MIFTVENMTCGYHGSPVLSNLSFSVRSGEILCILGPNGVGKTTLFKSMLGLQRPMAGTVSIDGEPISGWSNKKKAAYIGYIPQSHVPPFPYTVRQVVVMGRVGKLDLFASPGKEDLLAADTILTDLHILHLRDRIYTEISGGERQMVLIARALAQRPKVLLMDEPTANLDYGNQARVLEQIRRLAGQGMLVVMTTHSPDHALLCSSRVILVERQNVVRFGTAQEMVTEDNLRETYGIDVCLLSGLRNGRTVQGCIPMLSAEDKPLEEI